MIRTPYENYRYWQVKYMTGSVSNAKREAIKKNLEKAIERLRNWLYS